MSDLRELAKGARPGPWMSRTDVFDPEDNGIECTVEVDEYPHVIVQILTDFRNGTPGAWEGVEASQERKNCDFIAAANPTAILALLDERDALAEALDVCECQWPDVKDALPKARGGTS